MQITCDNFESSNITKFTYDTTDSVLYVTFKNGATYRYLDVSIGEFVIFMKSESVGKALNSQIKPFKKYEQVGV
jgi:hypothetical protein